MSSYASAGDCPEPVKLSRSEVHERLLQEGKRLYDSGRFAQAIKALSPALGDEFWGPVASITAARCYARLNQPDKVQSVLEAIPASDREGLYSSMIKELLAQALCDQGKEHARGLLSQMIHNRAEKDRPDLILKAAQLDERLGDSSRAVENYRRLFLRYPASVAGLKAEEQISRLVARNRVPEPVYTDSELLDRANRLSQKGRGDLAAQTYSRVLKKKHQDVKPNLQMAQCLFKARDNAKAISLLKTLLEQNIPDEERNDALYLLSRLYWRLDNEADFLDVCNQIVEKGPADFRKKALFNLSAERMEKGDLEKAQEYLECLLKEELSRSTTVDVLWKLGWVRYFRKQYDEAADVFGKARSAANGGAIKVPSLYWQAASLVRAGETSDAQPLLQNILKTAPLDYYGLQAAKLMESLGCSSTDDCGPGRAFPDLAITGDLKHNKNVKAALRLLDRGFPEFALKHLEALPTNLRSNDQIAFLTARAAYGSGDVTLANRIVTRKFPNLVGNPPPDAPEEFLEMAFPRVHESQTRLWAKKHSVDPNLVWAVIRQESCYDPGAVSPAGALGLMQVTPAASGLARDKEIPSASVIERLLNPKENIACGIKILAGNIRSFHGALAPAIASYNADIRKVRQWSRQRGDLKQDEFIETIPYLETRTYVKKVLAGYEAYCRIHSPKNLANLW